MSAIHSEDQLIAIIDRFFPRNRQYEHLATTGDSGVLLGRGDDCAEFFHESAVALSTDLFLEDKHFRRSYFTAGEIGHKALAINLSDLASSGAVPSGFSLGLMCPPDLDSKWLEDMVAGMSELATDADILLVGGDISAAPMLGFSITVWGSACEVNPDRENSFLRRGAQAGDILFALGPGCSENTDYTSIGLARLGLTELEAKGRSAFNEFPCACSALLKPVPMLSAGQALARLLNSYRVHCMDLSDGLARDLPRLLDGYSRNGFCLSAPLASGRHSCISPTPANKLDKNDLDKTSHALSDRNTLGAELEFSYNELHPELRKRYGENEALAEFLSGGDEYVLLCACEPNAMDAVRESLHRNAPDIHFQPLGKVSDLSGIRWHGTAIDDIFSTRAFDHFI